MGNSQSLPPKKGGIEKLITNDQDINKVIAGHKTSTRRNGRYADPGEIMELKGHKYLINHVYRQTLGELNETNAKQEGYANLEEYKEAILSIHPGMPWLPEMKVWVHEFSAINE